MPRMASTCSFSLLQYFLPYLSKRTYRLSRGQAWPHLNQFLLVSYLYLKWEDRGWVEVKLDLYLNHLNHLLWLYYIFTFNERTTQAELRPSVASTCPPPFVVYFILFLPVVIGPRLSWCRAWPLSDPSCGKLNNLSSGRAQKQENMQQRYLISKLTHFTTR